MSEASIDLEQIQQRLDAGEHRFAIARLRDLIDHGVRAPDVYRLLALAHLKEGASDLAMAALGNARLQGTASTTETAFGRFLNREGYKEAALSCFLSAIELDPENEDALALICMHHADAGRPDLGLPYGQRSLEVREKQGDRTAPEVAAARPRPFDPLAANRNVISFSLFGDTPYYWDCAVANASMAYAIFPEWRCRFYCDSNVPESVRQKLLNLRCQVYVSARLSENWSGLFWRFEAFDDPNVNVVMVRDVDSPFTMRERLTVDEWLASSFPFHVIRDHPYHCEPMMAGLWGGWTGLLPPMTRLIGNYRDQMSDRYSDQKFLRLQIWPRIRNATLVHDRYFRLAEERHNPPAHPTELFTHIGMSWPKPKSKK